MMLAARGRMGRPSRFGLTTIAERHVGTRKHHFTQSPLRYLFHCAGLASETPLGPILVSSGQGQRAASRAHTPSSRALARNRKAKNRLHETQHWHLMMGGLLQAPMVLQASGCTHFGPPRPPTGAPESVPGRSLASQGAKRICHGAACTL